MSVTLKQIAGQQRGVLNAIAIVITISGLLSSGRSGYGQTNDHLYRSWRWTTAPATTRAVGLAGAYAAIGDDGGTASLNPAGIATLLKNELSVSLLTARPGTVGLDRLEAWTGVAAGWVAARISEKTAVACYFVRPRAGRMELSAASLPDGSIDAGYLDAIVTNMGFVLARRLADKLSLGIGVTATHLKLEGLQKRSGRGGVLELETGSAAGDTRVTASIGVLYEAGRALRFGLVAQPGASYRVDRTASRPSVGGIDRGSQYELRTPGLVAVAAAFRVSRHLQVSSQLDYVRYSEMKAFVRPGGATTGHYALSDGVEPRLGVELAYMLGRVSVQGRAGMHWQAPGSFSYRGPDPGETAAFAGSARRVISAAGASIGLRNGLTLDMGATLGGDRLEVVAGTRFRF